MLRGKNVLVTGSDGLIGRELVIMLEDLGANVTKCDIKKGEMHDLREYSNCLRLTANKDYVFHLAGIKGNPTMTKNSPFDFMSPMLQFDTNMITSSVLNSVPFFLYTSSIAVENPESDKYPAWAKLTAEQLIESAKIQFPDRTKFCIVRPANVYGRFDDLKRNNLMVVSTLIKKALTEKKLTMDKKGSFQERDFINAKDVARGMIKAITEQPNYPVNLCSGKGTQINQIASVLQKLLRIKLDYQDLNLILGPDKKVMKLNWDFKPIISLEEGIQEVIDYVCRDSSS